MAETPDTKPQPIRVKLRIILEADGATVAESEDPQLWCTALDLLIRAAAARG
jgi:hypothetical protein